MKWGGDGTAELTTLLVPANATLLDAMAALEAGAKSIVFIIDGEGRVCGSLTDGDIRRAVLAGTALDERCLERVMCRSFASATPETGLAEVLDRMRARGVGQLPVLDTQGRLCGLHTIGQMMTAQHRPNAALILAGGKGTRLYPLTGTTPKPMVTVAGRPILERLILHVMSCGIRQFFVSVNYLAHIIEDYFGDGSELGCHIEYVREDRPLGTGGPLALLDPSPTLPFVVLNGDIVTQCDVGRMLDFHSRGEYIATCGVRPYTVDIPFGVARIDGERLTALQEKPSQTYFVNAGIYVLSPEIIRRVPRDIEFPITSLLGQCLEEQCHVGAYVVEEEWIDVGRHEELRRAREGV